mmetsp:Transcript_7026/g.10069  ORF Transcript_7026/g.10069 Transcript_7026/m.10069 type:complete len:102 (-) Transcript_7026:146-451(-)
MIVSLCGLTLITKTRLTRIHLAGPTNHAQNVIRTRDFAIGVPMTIPVMLEEASTDVSLEHLVPTTHNQRRIPPALLTLIVWIVPTALACVTGVPMTIHAIW